MRRSWAILCALALGAALLAAGCSGATPGIVYNDDIFRIIGTTGYSGTLVTEAGNTAITGSGSQDITVTAVAGNHYTLTLWKTSADAQPLELQLVVKLTINGTPDTIVADSQSTTDPNVPVRVVLIP